MTVKKASAKADWNAERKALGKQFQTQWQRYLPFAEMRTDRWQKAKDVKAGKGSSLYDSALVFGKPKIGKNVWVGPYTLIDGTGGLTIGDGVDISTGAQLLTHSTHLRAVSEGALGTQHKPVRIGAHSFIGTHAVLMPGVTVGDHCVIGAGAIVLKDVPARSVVAGVPAVVIGRVEGSKGKTKIVFFT